MAAATRFVALPRSEQARAIETASSLLTVRIEFGIPRFRRDFGLPGITHVHEIHEIADLIEAVEATAFDRAITRTARHSPFRAVWPQQTFAAMLLLRPRWLAGTIYLSQRRAAEAGALVAHAWSRCGPIAVTGGAGARDFMPIAAFSG